MLAKIRSSVLQGIDAKEVTIEVDITPQGLPSFNIVGLPDTAVKESIKRVKKAIVNSGFKFPDHKITVNLAPAGIKKEGPSFDLPIAIGILAATEQIASEILSDIFVFGELSLDGSVRPLNGILPRAVHIKEIGIKKPSAYLEEGTFIRGFENYIIFIYEIRRNKLKNILIMFIYFNLITIAISYRFYIFTIIYIFNRNISIIQQFAFPITTTITSITF